MIGVVLKGYKIIDKIKEGSVGTIYKAVKNNQLYALKMLKLIFAQNSKKRSQFRREAELAKKQEHPKIIKVYEYFEVNPQPFFVMEYFDSENLKFSLWHLSQRVYKNEFYILRQVAEALEYLHNKGIVHRDIKPENILVNSQAEIKLIDFSIAQTKFDRLNPFSPVGVEGTPLYMSPEQIKYGKVDHRSDIYSFGALLYELLTKRPPFIGTSERSIFEKHLNQPPPSIKLYVKTASSELDNFVQKLLAKKPEHRFQSMSEILPYLYAWDRKDTEIRLRQVAKPPEDKHGT